MKARAATCFRLNTSIVLAAFVLLLCMIPLYSFNFSRRSGYDGMRNLARYVVYEDQDLDRVQNMFDLIANSPTRLLPRPPSISNRIVDAPQGCYFNYNYFDSQLLADMNETTWKLVHFVEHKPMVFCEDYLLARRESSQHEIQFQRLVPAYDATPASLLTLPVEYRPCIAVNHFRAAEWERYDRFRPTENRFVARNVTYCDAQVKRGCTLERQLAFSPAVEKCRRDTSAGLALTSVHEKEPFSLPYMTAMEDAIAFADGTVFNKHLFYKPPGLCYETNLDPIGNMQQHWEKNNITSQKLASAGRVVNLAGMWPNNAFHAIINMLMRVGAHLSEIKELLLDHSKTTVIFLPNMPKAFAYAFLELALGFKLQSPQLLTGSTVVRGDIVFIPSPSFACGSSPGPSHSWPLRDAFLRALLADGESHQNLIIVIRRKHSREIINHDQMMANLTATFAAENFVVIEPGMFRDLRWVWRQFSRAKVIIAPHGAGLTNMFVTPPGAFVFELLQKERLQVCFLSLAQEMAIHYTGVIFETSSLNGNFYVDGLALHDLISWLSTSLKTFSKQSIQYVPM